MNRKWFLLVFVVLLQGQNKSVPPRFAIQVIDSTGTVLETRNVAERPEASGVLIWRGPALAKLAISGQSLEISALALAYQIQGNSVAVKVEVSLSKTSREAIAAGGTLLHLDESAAFPEMAKFRLQPFGVRVVPAHKSFPGLFTTQSKARSLEVSIVDQFDYIGEARHGFRVEVRNNGKQAAIGVQVCGLCRSGKGCGGGGNRDAIQPRGTSVFEEGVGCGRPEDVVLVVAVEGAVFEDGAYEGNPEAIAPAAAELIAARIQMNRIRKLASEILADPAGGDAAKLTRLRAGVQALPEKPDEEVSKATRSLLRGLSQGMQHLSAFHITLGMGSAKRQAISALNGFERRGEGGESLAEWWRDWSRTF